MAVKIKLLVGILLLSSLIITGCGINKESALEDLNKELVRRDNEEIWNKGNLEMIEEFYSADFVQHFLPTGSETKVLKNCEITYAIIARLFQTGLKRSSRLLLREIWS